MEIFIILLSIICLFVGLIGSILPIIPGPPISLLGLFFFHFFTSYSIGFNTLLILSIVVLFVTILDYWLQLYGVQRFGGGSKAIYGTFIGLLIGIFLFPPFGVIFGPLLGAFIGSVIENNKMYDTIKITLGSFLGFITGTILKLLISGYMIYLLIIRLI